MKRAIVTIACGAEHEQMAVLSHPTFRAYAEKIGADFIAWTDYAGHILPAFKKVELGALLDTYDRVLYLDNDILVRDDAPDIFDVVPEGRLGLFEEGEYYTDSARAFGVLAFINQLGRDATAWDGKYYNTGVMVLSRGHQPIFTPPAVELAHFMEQSYLNAMISIQRADVFPLPYEFNRMCVVDTVYGDERFASYFVHYAGFVSSTTPDHVRTLMKSDLATWQRARPDYCFQKHLAFIVQGDLRRQIAAEPVIRYARDVTHASDHLVIVAPRPQLFAHLNLPIYTDICEVPSHAKYRRCYTAACTHRQHCVEGSMHAVNRAALDALDIELPLAARTLQLQVDPSAREAVREKIRPHDPQRLVAIHPAGGLANTFPPEFWQACIRLLAESGYTPAVIGNPSGDECPVVEFDRSGCLDLVGQLSIPQWAAFLAECRVFIAGDSPLVTMAGAFEPWIGLVSPSRDPEFVLPYRRGSPFWKAQALEQPGRYSQAAGARPVAASACRLPTPEAVVAFVDRAFGE